MKYVKHILCTFLFVFMFGSVSFADTGYTNHEIGDRILEIMQTDYNSSIYSPRGNDYDYLGSYINESPDTKILYCFDIGGWYYSVVGNQPVITQVGNNLYNVNTYGLANVAIFHDNAVSTGGYDTTFNGVSNVRVYGLFSDWFNPIDFETVYYDATIPLPNITVEYTDTHQGYNVPIYLYFNDINRLQDDYYIDYRVQFRPVTAVNVEVSRGSVTYSNAASNSPYYTYDVVKNEDLVSLDSLVTPTYYQNYKAIQEDLWEECLTTYAPAENVHFLLPESLNNNQLIESYKGRYLAYRTIQCMFGNYMRLWVRYFKIDEDGHYIVGAWKVWECYDSTTSPWGATLPEYYEPYTTAVGTTTSYTDNSADTNQNLPINQGTPTGENNPNITVTVNQNVPNYPNYPTAVSYNHDNVLVQFIQIAATLPQLFSGFSSFLTAAFAFIPAGIWSIIRMGFLSSIVIMIVKVL